MTKRQLMVCAIALFADGYSRRHIAQALNLTEDQAQELINAGADEQGNGTMGHMRNGPVQYRDDTNL